MPKVFFALIIFCIAFGACKRHVKQETFEGIWLVDSAMNVDTAINFKGSIKIFFVPANYQGQVLGSVEFQKKDSTVILPAAGVDIPYKWDIKDDMLILRLDEKAANGVSDEMRTYAKVYAGAYWVKRKYEHMIIQSPTTRLVLINSDDLSKKTIDDMFKGLIRKQRTSPY